jgi:hypothetical protein
VKQEEKEGYYIGEREQPDLKLESGQDKEFLWLLKQLIPNPEKEKEKLIKGC